jgi:peptide chain release factor 2
MDEESQKEDFWTRPTVARDLLKHKADQERVIASWRQLSMDLEENEVLLELAISEDDEATSREADLMSKGLEKSVREAEMRRMMSEEGDHLGAVVDINSGAGGTDAADWADMLKRMYLRWCDRMNFKGTVVDEQPAEEAGISHVTLEIEGAYAYGYMKSEIGVHRLVRISPFDSNARRHTAFASVAVYPSVDDDIEIDVKDSDLRIDTFRSTGAGGQHVNTTDSAVRITHVPTNTVVVCRSERSQHKNRHLAMKVLRSRLYQAEMEKRRIAMEQQHQGRMPIEWGSQIRSYVLQPYRMVKDLRTDMEMGDVDRFLDGDITAFMEAFLVRRASGA